MPPVAHKTVHRLPQCFYQVIRKDRPYRQYRQKGRDKPPFIPCKIIDNGAGIVKEESPMSPLETPPLNIFLTRQYKSANHGVSRVHQALIHDSQKQ